MTIEELLKLTQWVDAEIVKKQVTNKYQNLINILAINVQPNQAKQSFEGQKNDLITTFNDIDTYVLNHEQIDLLDKFEIYPYIGKFGIEQIEDILYKNVIDLSTTHKKFVEIHTKITAGITRINQIKNGLADVVELPEYADHGALLKIHFSGNASINNISDLKVWSGIWYDISRGIALAHGDAPESIKVVGAQQGSIIVVLAVAYGLVKTISEAILRVLQIAEKSLDIRKKVEEIKALKLSNRKIEQELEREAEKIKKEESEKLIEELLKKAKKDTDGEIKNALERSITKLIEFIEKGGEVDCYLPKESSEIDSADTDQQAYIEKIETIKVNFEAIRKIEHKIKMIEHHEECEK